MSDIRYRKVLMLGSKKVGKTSLLSAVTSREFDDEYYKTKRVVSFYDVKRRLEFIDTPGLDDKILDLMPDDKEIWDIENDPQIMSYFRGKEGQDLASISGFFIMYSSEDPVTKIMAFQLLHVVTQVYEETKKKPIWVVENEGSIMRVKQIRRSNIKDMERKTKDWGAKFFRINVKTNEGINNLMDKVAKRLGSTQPLQKLFPSTSSIVNSQRQRGGCEAGMCSVM
mmetsp:Transcript_29582/g.41239  ORF Transcript_29582/g.41239 Transcript_29582/m.41239 type:complete len:225 (+) Transcript_29582:117-791(+)